MSAASKSIALIVLAVLFSVYTNVILKARATAISDHSDQPWLAYVLAMACDAYVWSAVLTTSLSMVLSLIALRDLDLSVAQPIFALNFVLIPLAAVFLLGEHLPPLRIAGLILIFAGVVLVARTA